MQTAIVAWIIFLIPSITSQSEYPPIYEKVGVAGFDSVERPDVKRIQWLLTNEFESSVKVLFTQSIHFSNTRFETQIHPLIGPADLVHFRNLTFDVGHSFGVPILKIFVTEQHQYQMTEVWPERRP